MTHRQLKEVNFLGWLFCAAITVIEINQFATVSRQIDFGYFYSLGRIMNNYSPQGIYDISLQAFVFKHGLPGSLSGTTYGPGPYPPFVAMLFRPFALLPFWTAFLAWSILSLGLYVGGLVVLVKRFCPGDLIRQSILCCVGLSLWSFSGRTLMNGQLSSLGLFAVALAVSLDEINFPFLAGAALAICAYKPTLLLLIIPMIVIMRRRKLLAGFLLSLGVLTIFTTLLEGWRIWPEYLYLSFHFPRQSIYLNSDHVDLLTFSDIASHEVLPIQIAILAGGLVAFGTLARIWWLSSRHPDLIPQRLVWGTTITWNLLLNVYAPLYDSTLVLVSLIATQSLISKFNRRIFVSSCLLIVISSYGAREIADATGVQVVTLVLAAFGTMQMIMCFRALKGGAIWLSEEGDRVSSREMDKLHSLAGGEGLPVGNL